MILHTLTVPGDPADLPRWLERRLMARDFSRFLAELQAYFPPHPGDGPPGPALEEWLPRVLDEGLAPLPADALRQLLRRPRELAALQERVALDGGPYWDQVLGDSAGLTESFERGRASLDALFAVEDRPPVGARGPRRASDAGPVVVPSGAVGRREGRGYRVWAFASTAVAACLAVAVGWLALSAPDEPPVMKSQIAWGWGKPSGLAHDQARPRDYLARLAANAEEWSLYRPADANEVGARIAEFRAGCTRLMHSSYGPLAPADKEWLLGQCRAWAKELDARQQELDAGADALAVRAEVDETVRQIAAALRDRAKQIG